jgi:hypothetical protein
MRKLVLQMGVSLDGLVAKPGRHGSGGWGLPPEDPALKERKLAWLRDTGLHVMGRVTYEEMVEFWPRSDDAYATPMNDIPKARAPLDQMIEMGDFRKSRRRDRSSRRSWIRRQAALPACAAVGRPFRWSDRREARSRSGSRSVRRRRSSCRCPGPRETRCARGRRVQGFGGEVDAGVTACPAARQARNPPITSATSANPKRATVAAARLDW